MKSRTAKESVTGNIKSFQFDLRSTLSLLRIVKQRHDEPHCK